MPLPGRRKSPIRLGKNLLVAKPKLRYVSRKYIIAKGFGSCNQKVSCKRAVLAVRQRDKILCPTENLHFDCKKGGFVCIWKNRNFCYVVSTMDFLP